MTTLCFFRFWLGFGIGGDYPLSATIMSEYANKKTRGAFIAAVFAMQGFGILVGGVFAIVIAFVFFKTKFSAPPYEVDPLGSTVPQADYVWRIILMAGALPAALTYYWRLKMPETARYTALVAKNMEQAATDMSKVMQVEIQVEPETEEKAQGQYGLLSKEFLTRHGLHLLGTTSTWFLLDIAFYSQNLFQKDIFSAIGWIPSTKTMNALEEVFRIARAQTLIALCSTVPGYWFTVAFIDRIGRFIIQLMGFFFMTVFMYTLAIPYDYWTLKENRIGFVVLYSLTFFFANFGPNATTFVVPAEIFPARFRSTCHGISSASGKLGAMVGAFGFLYLAQNQDKSKTDAGYPAGIGVKNSLIVLGVVNILGFLFTFLVPEAKGRSLEDISGTPKISQYITGMRPKQHTWNKSFHHITCYITGMRPKRHTWNKLFHHIISSLVKVATMCKERLHEIVKEEVEKAKEDLDWEITMKKCFARMDEEVQRWTKSKEAPTCRCELQTQHCDAIGSTAIVVVVTPDKIIIANCGESRTVLCQNNVAVPLFDDHKPDRADELGRIQAARGRVIYT
uniref:Inorganic phosphate transporter 1-7 n=1 Tax=Cajanus cajan TaxID=3821 RepID=A0A151S2Z1_CAJCA|nr:putative inorganic phosphate transporter 1-7 [Cajanus cajan]